MSKLFEALEKNRGAVQGTIAQEILAATQAMPEIAAPGVAAAPAGLAENSPMLEQVGDRYRTIAMNVPANAPVLPFDGKHWHANEQYRVVRTKILQHPKSPRVMVVSSAGPGDGKTVTSINVAGALALRADAEVILIDADLRRAKVHNWLGIPRTPGLSEVLTGRAPLNDAIVRLKEYPHLHILPAGEGELNPAELLDSAAWAALCASLRARFRFVLIDSPPIATVADYDLLQAQADGVLLIVRPDHTRRSGVLNAIKTIPQDKLVGVVLNCVSDWFVSKAYGYGQAYYEY